MALANNHLGGPGYPYDRLADIEKRLRKIDGQEPERVELTTLTLDDWQRRLSDAKT